MTAIIHTLSTPDGAFTLLVDESERVIASGWTAEPEAIVVRLSGTHRPDRVISGVPAATAAVDAYYAGDLTAIDTVEVRQFGTDLQLHGWAGLRELAPGHALTYSEFAAELGRPRAVRAAASICARNAPALFVPCHRVLRGDGSLGGFAWGLDVKRSLLERESSQSTR